MKCNLLAFLLLLPAIIYAQQWSENGTPVQNREHMASKNGFGAMILMTTDSKTALENWEMLTEGVSIPQAEKVEKGNPIEALILFSGCKPNNKGDCITEADYQIIKPDGSMYAEHKNTEIWRGKPAIPEGRLELAVDRVGLVAEPDDPVGIYKVVCTVRDLVGNIEFRIFSTFAVFEANKPLRSISESGR